MATCGMSTAVVVTVLVALIVLRTVTYVSASDDVSCSRVFDECTWCVALYREGGDVSRGQRTESGLYCGGSLVSPRVVLTAAKCAHATRTETVRARLPSGDYPDHVYTVVRRITHPRYASGNRSNKLALMVLNEDVETFGDFSGQACMEFNAPRRECQAIGFSLEETLEMSPVSVTDGHCSKKRRDNSLACGDPIGLCNALVGSPVICTITKDEQGGMAIAGVVQRYTPRDKVVLSKVQPQRNWLTRELKKLGVEFGRYTP